MAIVRSVSSMLMVLAAAACAARAPEPRPDTAQEHRSSGWNLDTQPVPRTLDEALGALERGLGGKTIERLRIEEEDVAIRLVPTLGRWMQDHWALATGGPLARFFEDRGLDRPDDMAAVILTSLWRTLHFRQIRLEEQIAWYRAVKYQR
jgi:uncharacterized protein DUF6794